MALLIECYSVIVPRRVLAARYPGGVAGFESDCLNTTFLMDEHLCRVGFMVESDAARFIAQLAGRGLMPARDGRAQDVALVSALDGLSQPCSWLSLERQGDHLIVWLAGTDRGAVIGEARSSLKQVSAEEFHRRYEFLRTEGAVDVYRDRDAGGEVYVGRTAPPPDDRHDEFYKRACKLIEGLIQLGRPLPPLTVTDRQRLKQAAELFVEVVRINPANWAALWMLGKIFQRCNSHEEALKWFAHAHRVNPDHPDVAREASIEAMEVGQPEEAVTFCRRALKANPNDAGLRANLALSLLFSVKPGEAKVVADDALRRDPKDRITASIVGYINDVVAGRRKCPRHVREMV